MQRGVVPRILHDECVLGPPPTAHPTTRWDSGPYVDPAVPSYQLSWGLSVSTVEDYKGLLCGALCSSAASTFRACSLLPRQVEALTGKSYEALRKFISEVELKAREQVMEAARARRRKAGSGVSPPKFVFFETKMEQVHAGDDDASVGWVLKGKKEDWKRAMQSKAKPSR